jgi:hypothetical protein
VDEEGGKIVEYAIMRAYDFQQFGPGLWLPRRWSDIRSAPVPDGKGMLWRSLETGELLYAQVNQPLSEDFFENLVFQKYPGEDLHTQRLANAYDQRLADAQMVPIEGHPQCLTGLSPEALDAVVAHGISVKDLLAWLGKQVAQGPPDPNTFLEPLPTLP